MANNNSFVILPYLKTSRPVQFKQVMFRGVEDVTDLSEEDQEHLQTLRAMFFLCDHLQIQQMAITLVPRHGEEVSPEILQQLVEFHTILGYLYSSPHHLFGDPFLTYEHASLYLFTPKRQSMHLIASEHNVVNVRPDDYPEADARNEVAGYDGLLNFKTHLWVTRGSRIYPPAGRLWLNISQDLYLDFEIREQPAHERPLMRFFDTDGPTSPISDRVLRALSWYNRSTTIDVDDEVALVNLAIAFECLLDLEQGEKITNRFKEAVNLLLGGVPRLDSWLTQFYNVRSQLIHEGQARNLYFLATDEPSKKTTTPPPMYRSLVSYGRQIFQLCVGAILSGAMMAEEVGLSAAFVTNQQRFEAVCAILDKGEGSPRDRLLAAASHIQDIDTFKFVGETGLQIETLMGAARLAVQRYLETAPIADAELLSLFSEFTQVKKGADYFEPLSKLEEIQTYRNDLGDSATTQDKALAIVFSLLDSMWHYTFMHYFWLKDEKAKNAKPGASA